jgi:hypothetical protein
MPLPRIFIMRDAAADRDRAGVHVTIVDVPAFLTGIGRSAAGEFGHSPSNCRIEGVGKPSYSLSLKIRAESARGGTRGPPEGMPWRDQLILRTRRARRQITKGTVYDAEQSGDGGLVRGNRIEVAHFIEPVGLCGRSCPQTVVGLPGPQGPL